MSRELHPTIVVTDLQVRMVILDIGDMRHRVHETHGAIKVFEGECTANGAGVRVQRPATGQLAEQLFGLASRERRHAPFTSLAFLLREHTFRPPASCSQGSPNVPSGSKRLRKPRSL